MPAVRVRDEGRIERLISIAYFLSTKSEIHIDELCERLDISRKQVEDDLNVLMFCGLPPYSPEQLFDIMIEDDFVSMYFNDVFIAPLRLNQEEKAHLLVALSRLESQTTDESEIKSIKQVQEQIDGSNSGIVQVQAPLAKFDKIIQEAISNNQIIEIEYLSLNSASISKRNIEPKSIFTTPSITYVFAFVPEIEDYRIFRTDRILDASLIEEPQHAIKSGLVLEPDFSDQEPSQLFVEQKETYVDLRVDNKATWVLDSYPHEIIDEDGHIYRFFTTSPFFAARLILSNVPYVSYSGGTFKRATILEALNKIHQQMQVTAK